MNDLDTYILSLLRIAKEEKAEVTETKIQKIFFLLEKELKINLNLEFVPYLFGPYSWKLRKEVEKVIKEEKIKADEEKLFDPITNIELGAIHKYYTDSDVTVDKKVEEFFREWVKKSRKEILSYVYKNYPEYINHTLIRDKVAEFMRKMVKHNENNG